MILWEQKDLGRRQTLEEIQLAGGFERPVQHNGGRDWPYLDPKDGAVGRLKGYNTNNGP